MQLEGKVKINREGHYVVVVRLAAAAVDGNSLTSCGGTVMAEHAVVKRLRLIASGHPIREAVASIPEATLRVR